MELRHLRYFVAVAEELHFGRAAARLHIAQPPLSQQIKTLEDELGVRLFNRNRRKVELTDAGVLFLPQARRTLEHAAVAEQVARDAGKGVRGHLDVGFVTSASYSILPTVIRQFRTAYPLVELALHEMIPAEQLTALARREIDVGLLRLPVPGASCAVEPILAEPLVCAVPTEHALAARKRIRLSTLSDEPFILFPRRHGPGIYDVIMEACRGAGFSPRVAHEANEMQAILAYVAGGLGVALVPASLRGFHPGAIRYLPLQGCSSSLRLALGWDDSHPSRTVTQFRDVARGVAAEFSVR